MNVDNASWIDNSYDFKDWRNVNFNFINDYAFRSDFERQNIENTLLSLLKLSGITEKLIFLNNRGPKHTQMLDKIITNGLHLRYLSAYPIHISDSNGMIF